MYRSLITVAISALIIAIVAVAISTKQSATTYEAKDYTSTSTPSSSPINAQEENLKTYKSEEYGFSFQYHKGSVVYDMTSGRRLDPSSDEPIVAWVELPEKYESSVVGGVMLNVRIEILEGDYSSVDPDYGRYAAVKRSGDKTFTVRYSGLISLDGDPSLQTIEVYMTIRDTFEIDS